MDIYQLQESLKLLFHILFAVLLIVALLGIATWLGMLRCSTIPGWCSVYYAILGPPKVLIVYGNDGLGDPQKLAEVLANKKILGIRPRLLHLSQISTENLKDYQLVIVEHAKTMSTKKLLDFMKYVDSGGRLIWVGDAGTALTKGDEYVYEDELYQGKEHKIISPWIRKYAEGGQLKVVNFENYISVRFKGNFCEIYAEFCKGGIAGRLFPPSTEHRLVYGMQVNLPYRGDFSIVKEVSGAGTKIVLVLNTDFGIKVGEENLGTSLPFIVTSGIGERVAYYAFPPEQLAELKYSALIENMYYGMLE
ncbi:hypothetical protein DRJ19_01035 [Candidatus Woesearchaeota archaeon]|nr:MAG: hypothetical protein DRJ19_01035 [Candidatus Woesearchaeota archaeon]